MILFYNIIFNINIIIFYLYIFKNYFLFDGKFELGINKNIKMWVELKLMVLHQN